MIELGQGAAAPVDAGASDLIKDTTEATFMADVIEMSQTIPVVVDFWAPWCGPCKTLGPQLEEAVKAAGGRVRMVKVNVDENQQIAAQLQIQSIPTVYGFFEGKPVDGFQGAVQQSDIKTFVDKLAALGPEPDNGLADAIEAAEGMLTDGDFEDASQTFAAVMEEEPDNAAAIGGLVRSLIALDDLEQAEAVLNGASAEVANAPELEAAHAQLELAKQAADAGPVADLRAAVAAAPDDLQIRFDFATALHGAGDVDEAISELLEIFRRDREWNDGAAKAQLFTIFDALTPQDPIALNGRRRLSSMIFV